MSLNVLKALLKLMEVVKMVKSPPPPENPLGMPRSIYVDTSKPQPLTPNP